MELSRTKITLSQKPFPVKINAKNHNSLYSVIYVKKSKKKSNFKRQKKKEEKLVKYKLTLKKISSKCKSLKVKNNEYLFLTVPVFFNRSTDFQWIWKKHFKKWNFYSKNTNFKKNRRNTNYHPKKQEFLQKNLHWRLFGSIREKNWKNCQ